MILAAGLGTRMAPLTRSIAKPALPILDEPLVRRLARTLTRQGIEAIVVNAHAHVDTVREALGGLSVPVRVSLEQPQLLGSGGGIRAARELLDYGEPFLVVNGDMALDLDVHAIASSHRSSGALITLALRDDDRKGDFGTIGYDSAGRVRRITSRLDLGGEGENGLFIGVHVMEPDIFDYMPDGGAFEIFPDVYEPALRGGALFQAWLQPSSARWWPVGCPGELLDANLLAVAEMEQPRVHVAPDAHVDGELAAPVWIGAGANVEDGARVGPNAVVGAGARVGRGAEVRDALLLPRTELAAGAILQRAIGFGTEVWRDV